MPVDEVIVERLLINTIDENSKNHPMGVRSFTFQELPCYFFLADVVYSKPRPRALEGRIERQATTR